MTTSTPRAAISAFSYSRGFLSNFWIQPIKLQVHGRDVVAPSAEHAFLGIKSERWEDAERILAAESPGYAMQISESVAAREDWNTIRIGAMDHVLRAKFAEGSELAQRLIDTGDATLRDGNLLNKTFWGGGARSRRVVAWNQLARRAADAAPLTIGLEVGRGGRCTTIPRHLPVLVTTPSMTISQCREPHDSTY